MITADLEDWSTVQIFTGEGGNIPPTLAGDRVGRSGPNSQDSARTYLRRPVLNSEHRSGVEIPTS